MKDKFKPSSIFQGSDDVENMLKYNANNDIYCTYFLEDMMIDVDDYWKSIQFNYKLITSQDDHNGHPLDFWTALSFFVPLPFTYFLPSVETLFLSNDLTPQCL